MPGEKINGRWKWLIGTGDGFSNAKPMPLEMIKDVVANTRSNMDAINYIGVSIDTWKKYANSYLNEDGITYYQAHRGDLTYRRGKTPIHLLPEELKARHLNSKNTIGEVLEGKIKTKSTSRNTIIASAIRFKLIKEHCYQCHLSEKRMLDNRMPLLLVHKDGDPNNFKKANIKFYCYNCYFYYVGDIFNITKGEKGPNIYKKQVEKDLQGIEGTPDETFNWDIDENYERNLKELGLIHDEPIVNEMDGLDLIVGDKNRQKAEQNLKNK